MPVKLFTQGETWNETRDGFREFYRPATPEEIIDAAVDVLRLNWLDAKRWGAEYGATIDGGTTNLIYLVYRVGTWWGAILTCGEGSAWQQEPWKSAAEAQAACEAHHREQVRKMLGGPHQRTPMTPQEMSNTESLTKPQAPMDIYPDENKFNYCGTHRFKKELTLSAMMEYQDKLLHAIRQALKEYMENVGEFPTELKYTVANPPTSTHESGGPRQVFSLHLGHSTEAHEHGVC